jgi:nitrite reductase (NADH) large subunit
MIYFIFKQTERIIDINIHKVVNFLNDIVIIGGGVASVNAVKAIREINSDLNVTILQNESIYPYYRTRLTKSLFENLGADNILLQKKEWYEQNKVNLHLNNEVVAIDTDRKIINLTDGTIIQYDTLLLANGAYNFRPPIDGIDKENVLTIRNFEDVQTIREQVKDKKTILHIGGGIQNLEAAWAICSQGKSVIVAEFMDRLMPRQLDVRASEILKNAVEGFNVKVKLDTQIVEITGENAVTGAKTKNGETLDCDFVIYCVGIRPNKKIVENTAIQTNMGIIVDDHMRTNNENIYAAGDVAEFEGRVGGLWPIAIEQGKVAGYNMVGKDTAYQSIMSVTTMIAFHLSIFSVGNIDESSYSITIINDPEDGTNYKRIFILNDFIIGAIIIGDTKNNQMIKKAIESKTLLSDIDLTNISVDELLSHLKNL